MTLFRKLFLPSSLAVLLLTGCGLGPAGKQDPVTVTVAAGTVSGVFMGGQQPVGGVALQLYAAGTTGYGSAATPLLTPGAAKTTSNGNFDLPAFTCPTAGTPVYLVGTGGQPIAGVTNSNLALMVGLGACSAIGNSFINVNELTTVATIWALSPFMSGISNIGSSATNPQGIMNAFAAINKLVNTANGQVAGPALPTNATLPIAELNTLADMLEQCVNSGGGSASDSTDGQTNGTPCGKLFFLAGGSATTDTITAAMQIAQNPGRNVAKLNVLRSASPVFVPTLSVNSPPTDWTVAIKYSGGGLSSPQGIATDQAGNVWVANPGNNSVTEFAPTGAPLSGTAGFPVGGAPYAVAIDPAGNAWVANSGNSTLTRLASNGAAAATLSGNGLSAPKSIAVDAAGNVFASNSTGTGVSGFTNTGTPLPGSPFTGTNATMPVAVTITAH